MACIYKITNLINNKFYIGSTQSSFKKRIGEHLSELNGGYHKNKHLQSSFNKYGKDNFIFEILEEFKFPINYTREYIYEYITERELYYITSLNPQYNIARETKAGKLGRVPSQEERDHLRKIHTGRKVSEETKKKIREARAKQVITEEHKRNISKGMLGKKFPNRPKISEETKLKASKSTKYLADNKLGCHSQEAYDKRKRTLKIKFNTPELKEKIKFNARNRNKRPFLCFDKNDTFIGEFLSQADTADLLNLKSSELCAVLRQEQKTTKGYKFIYKDIYYGELYR